MTIKAQATFFWRWKQPVRELKVGDEIFRLGMIDPFSREGAAEIARVVSPDEMTLHQKMVGGLLDSRESSTERPLKIKINGGIETSRLRKSEITDYGSRQTLGDILSGFTEKVWWEPTPESDMSQARRK